MFQRRVLKRAEKLKLKNISRSKLEKLISKFDVNVGKNPKRSPNLMVWSSQQELIASVSSKILGEDGEIIQVTNISRSKVEKLLNSFDTNITVRRNDKRSILTWYFI